MKIGWRERQREILTLILGSMISIVGAHINELVLTPKQHEGEWVYELIGNC